MMYRWWCEGGGDRAWWDIESVFLRSPDKGFWACLGDIPPDMPRRPETWVSLYNWMMKLCGILRSSAILGSDSPQSSNRKDHSLWVTPFIPRERPNVKHAIAGYLRLPQPTSASALMRVLHWLRCWAEEPGYATGDPPEDYSQIRGGCICPWILLQVGLIYIGTLQAPEVPTFKSSHVPGTSSHHAYGTHYRLLNQLYNYYI